MNISVFRNTSSPALVLQVSESDATFFLERGGGAQAAREMCTDCPVRDQLPGHGLDNKEAFGIWRRTAGPGYPGRHRQS